MPDLFAAKGFRVPDLFAAKGFRVPDLFATKGLKGSRKKKVLLIMARPLRGGKGQGH